MRDNMGEKLFLKPKMGIVPELSIQNYDTVAKQLREVVSNAKDANAQSVHISLLMMGNKSADLMIEDDGDGMSLNDLREEFLALGGSKKFFDKTKIGRIGIGFLAVVPLCEAVEIKTRKRGSNQVIVARLDSKKLMLEELRTKTIHNLPVGEVKEIISSADKFGYPPHFTKISLVNVKPFVIEDFKKKRRLEDLREDLRKILPLAYNPKSKIFNHISKGLGSELIESSKKHSLNVYLNSDMPLTRRTYGDHKDEQIYAVREFNNIRTGNMRLLGYLIRKENSEGRRSPEVKKWDGLIVRVQNVAVVDSGFLGLKGREERKRRVCGDILISGIDKNKAITIDRNNFKEDDPQYQRIRNYVHRELEKFFLSLNYDWELKTELNKTIGIAQKLNKAMESASKGISKIKKSAKPKQESLKESRKINLIDLKNIHTKYTKLSLEPEQTLSSRKPYKIIWKDIVGQRGSVKIDATLYNKRIWEFEIENVSYKCEFVDGKLESAPCEFDSKNKEFYINRNNPLIKSLKAEYIVLCILIEYARVNSNNKDELAAKLYSLMEGLVK